MTDGGWVAARPETAVLMLAASGPDQDDDAVTVRVRHEPGYVLLTLAGEVDFASVAGLRERLFSLTRLDQAVPLAASLAEAREAAGADAEAV